MTWTYSGDPSSSDRDAVRFTTGDTSSSDELVSDEEIAYALTTYGSVLSASIAVSKAIAAKFARYADMAVGDLRQSYSQRYKQYTALVTELENQLKSGGVNMYAGGRTITDKDAVREDTNRVRPSFSRGQFKNPETRDPNRDTDSEWFCS